MTNNINLTKSETDLLLINDAVDFLKKEISDVHEIWIHTEPLTFGIETISSDGEIARYYLNVEDEKGSEIVVVQQLETIDGLKSLEKVRKKLVKKIPKLLDVTLEKTMYRMTVDFENIIKNIQKKCLAIDLEDKLDSVDVKTKKIKI